MLISPLTDAADLLRRLIEQLQDITRLIINLTIGLAVVLLLLRLLTDVLKVSPFGRLVYYARRPTNDVIHQMRSSRFYYPLKQAFGFDPAAIMVLIALAILWYVVTGVLGNLFTILSGLAMTLHAFGVNEVLTGVRYLIGTSLLAVILFLLSLMTLLFVNWLFGLFNNAAYWAQQRIGPLLRLFEFGGIFTGWSFLILWLALSFAAAAVTAIFF